MLSDMKHKYVENSKALERINWILLPVKFVIQPWLHRIPFFTSNEDIRLNETLKRIDGYLLDIGCRHNHLVERYRQMGGRGIGVDVHGWKGSDLVVDDTACLSFENETFDSVTMIACINHIPNRRDVLKEVHRILRANGRLILTNLTPAISWMWHQVAIWDRGERGRGMKKGEVYGLQSQTLRPLLSDTGFHIEKKDTFSWGMNQIYLCRKKTLSQDSCEIDYIQNKNPG